MAKQKEEVPSLRSKKIKALLARNQANERRIMIDALIHQLASPECPLSLYKRNEVEWLLSALIRRAREYGDYQIIEEMQQEIEEMKR